MPGTQLPSLQPSFCVQALLSSHAARLSLKLQPVLAEQLSSVQTLPSLQTNALPALQAEALHTSPTVHALPSSQDSAFATFLQPLVGSQLSVLQALLSSQVVATPGRQMPPLHASPWVHALLSLHSAIFAAKTQPILRSHLSSLHGLLSLHTTNLPATQPPSAHTSPAVQASPSSQITELALFLQPLPASQLSVVHSLLSSQFRTPPGLQLPPPQASAAVHAFPSLQATVFAVEVQPIARLQTSSVQGLLSLHTTGWPAMQAPSLHASPLVHWLLSLQGSLLLLCTQPLVTSQLSMVQEFLSSQLTAAPLTQVPTLHESAPVHTLLSSQTLPSLFAVTLQLPSARHAAV